MKYFIDFEFIEDGITIDPISLGIVSEDNRELYVQFEECNFTKANDWVWRNVYPYLTDFDFSIPGPVKNGVKDHWFKRNDILPVVYSFIDIKKYKDIEFWGYYSAYDWVAFCQIFGRMMNLPNGYPMYCNDLVQLANSEGNPKFDFKHENEHNALADARWNKKYYEFLRG